MKQSAEQFNIRTIYVYPEFFGFHLDYVLGQEAPLFAPPRDSKLLCGVGYDSSERRKALGMPHHEKTCRSYRKWLDMINRCYNSKATAYANCTVCPMWQDFQEFADWFVSQPYKSEADMELDKDILDPLNTMYSPEFCSLVPRVINQMFRDTRSQRGGLPIGVTIGPRGKDFVSRISKHGKQFYLGKFRDIIAAFDAYKTAHRDYCYELAEKYEDLIDARVIERLRAYSRHVRD
ncbi:hypothetical protein F6476_08905 [Pseudomonas umsongensis]|uniref:Uncharacterized protein n=1 Tax=Pseudomonas umsongensis TaxID=198618 RepID=A0ABX4DN28_9PSED|nr:hypothetical protein [Pseudomonas umsongensis]OXR27852.1 hypothetical protein PSUM_30280 [Pseudomonas umsongensis]QFG29310.1 hypothetical protein F6476_08905 [Pseudomonas umsongensis]SDS83125.1 hypothetical protein SAMN04490206_1514 [Pseudomonas umsongensis]